MSQIVQQCLDAHNEYRRKHGAPPLVISKSLMRMAQNWAQSNANRCQMQHSTGRGGIGENLYCGSASLTNGKRPVESWYNEVRAYRFNQPGFSFGTGHFTQVVWKGSRELGVGWARGRNGWTYFCCNYSPAGNYQGQFRVNVLPLGTRPPATMSVSRSNYAPVYCESSDYLNSAVPDDPEEANEAEDEAEEAAGEEAEEHPEEEEEETGEAGDIEEDIGEASEPEGGTGEEEPEEAEEGPEAEVEEETGEASDAEKEEETEEASVDDEGEEAGEDDKVEEEEDE